MALSLTVLGCDGSHAGPGGAASGYLVRAWPGAIWVDAGSGTFANLQRFCVPEGLDAIVLTHSHRDHWSDLDGFVVAARYTAGRRRPRMRVIAAPGIREQMNEGVDEICEWEVIDATTEIDVAGMRLRFSRTDHPPPTYAVRIEGGGRTLGYSADSGPGWSMAELGRDLDLALCEATYTEEHEGTAGHMSARQAGATARTAGAARLVVTHRWPTVPATSVRAEAEASFGAPVGQAVAGHGWSI